MMLKYCVNGLGMLKKNDPDRGRGARILRQHQGNWKPGKLETCAILIGIVGSADLVLGEPLISSGTTLANLTSHVTRFIKMCDVEQPW